MTPPRLIHGICTYWRQWLVADERGWRSVDHKIHCSGDYKNPPPPEEHAGLRKYVEENLGGDPVCLDSPEFAVGGSAFVMKIFKMGSAVRCLSCGPTHVHLLYDSIADDAKPELGKAKQYASLQLASKPDGFGRGIAPSMRFLILVMLRISLGTFLITRGRKGRGFGVRIWMRCRHGRMCSD